ncbi:MAG: glycosyltransferase, partial [Kiritimatiellae bacterium]|nr:glycosyltransferase [Kiritimatiellia bacterium]
MNTPPTIRVVIPVYQDRVALTSLLPGLLAHWHAEEILVVDAGDDGAEAFARSLGVPVIRASPGRANQMNTGAKHAGEADLYLFLHADTRLPPEARERLARAYADGIVGGAFSRRFDSPSRFLKLTCALADVRGKTLGLFLGDQAIFARKDVFE